VAEVLVRKGALNTYRLRLEAGMKPAPFKRALNRLERGLFTARCGATTADTVWPAAIIDLAARVFPKAGGEASRLSEAAARSEAGQRLAALAPELTETRRAMLLTG
jgi:hypothetical protein